MGGHSYPARLFVAQGHVTDRQPNDAETGAASCITALVGSRGQTAVCATAAQDLQLACSDT
jgi:hypothetical protein